MPRKTGILDAKDRRILQELEENARQSDSAIAKKVRLSKQVVNYRIGKMMELGAINNFYTVVNVGNLGLTTYYLFLQLEKINPEKEKEFLRKVERIDTIGWLVSCIGKWNVILNINEDSSSNFEKTLNKILGIFGKHVYDYKFTILSGAEHLGYKSVTEKRNSSPLYQGEREKIFKLDITDERILRALSQNAREDLVSLSDKTKIPLHVVSYRLKKMIKKGIIEGFKPKLNIGKLGYYWSLLLFKFDSLSKDKKEEIVKFCKIQKEVYYITSTIGEYNLMIDLHVLSPAEMENFVNLIRKKFGGVVRTYESVIISEEHKIDYIPKGITTTALLFDLDGTLVNTENFDGKILDKILRKYGVKKIKAFAGQNLDTYLTTIISDKNLKKKIKNEFIAEYESILKNIQIEINNELVKYLRLGITPLVALVTANNRRLTQQILHKSGLAKYFEIIITCDDVKKQKPFPDPYLKAMKELNVSPENCIVFEDSETGLTSAKEAGIKTVRKVAYR